MIVDMFLEQSQNTREGENVGRTLFTVTTGLNLIAVMTTTRSGIE